MCPTDLATRTMARRLSTQESPTINNSNSNSRVNTQAMTDKPNPSITSRPRTDTRTDEILWLKSPCLCLSVRKFELRKALQVPYTVRFIDIAEILEETIQVYRRA